MANFCEKIHSCFCSKPVGVLVGIWEDEHKLVHAAHKAREAGFKDLEAVSPFPLHGIDEALGIPRSYIPYITFAFGLAGCVFGIWFTWWTSADSWALNVGGKPMWSLPAFIPVIFECTILAAALSSVAAMIIINGLPKVDPVVIDPALTSHKFALMIPLSSKTFNEEKISRIFKENGAQEVRRAEF